MNKGITVAELYLLCRQEIKNGNGEKHIQISSDEEGNNYHALYFSFTTNKDDIQYCIDEYLIDNNFKADEIVLLG